MRRLFWSCIRSRSVNWLKCRLLALVNGVGDSPHIQMRERLDHACLWRWISWLGEWAGGWAGVEGTATWGVGKLIRVQESSEQGKRLDLHKAHLHNVLHKLCSQKASGRAGRWGGGGGRWWLDAWGGSSQGGRARPKAGPPPCLLAALSVPTTAHPAAASPQASPRHSCPSPELPHTIQPPQCSQRFLKSRWDHSSPLLKAFWWLPQD